MKQKWAEQKKELEEFTIVVQGFNIPHPIIDKSRKKISGDEDLKNIINHHDLIDIYKILYSTT